MFLVYILFSESLDRYYIGHTNNLERRLAEHNRIKGKYTDAGIPWKIVHIETFNSKEEAYDRERYIKSRKSRDYVRSLISSSDNGTANDSA